jgi:HlyD family secretion protein
MKKGIIIGAVILVVIVCVIVGLTVFSRGDNNKTKYKTGAVDRGDIEALVTSSGTLNPVTTVEVGSQVSGKIDKLYADFNSHVKEGQLLAEIDQSQFLTKLKQNEANYQSAVASLAKAKVTLENSKKKYERALSLFEKNLISYEEKDAAETEFYNNQAELQASQARLEQAKSALDSSRVDLTYTIIKSPIDGVVISRNVNVGQTVAASFQAPVLFTIANDLTQMQVECSVDEADIGKVKEGQNVRFTVDAFPEERFAGTVKQVRYSPQVVQNVVTYTTVVEVKNPELKLLPGMTATVSIISGEARNALRVPNAALRFNPNLSAEEMKKIAESMRQQFAARSGEREGGSNQQNQQNRASRPEGSSSQRQGGQRPSGGEGQQSFMMGGSGGSGGQTRRGGARVWIEDANGKLKPVFLRTGVTDNNFTEVVSGDLKEGQLVITGVVGTQSTAQGGGPPRGMMFRF